MFDYLGMAYKDSDYTVMIAITNVNFCTETHLDGEDTSAFVFPSAAIARALSSTLIASTAPDPIQ